MKFIILALPRTGTKMLCSALATHPDVDYVRHEFRGTEVEFLEHPMILSNYVNPWMAKYPTVHMYRENACAGAVSMLLMPYIFPPNAVDMPESEVIALANQRKAWDAEMASKADYSFSYESLLTDGFCGSIPADHPMFGYLGLSPHELRPSTEKVAKIPLRNQEAIACLSV